LLMPHQRWLIDGPGLSGARIAAELEPRHATA
jgi:hypothetical protein